MFRCRCSSAVGCGVASTDVVYMKLKSQTVDVRHVLEGAACLRHFDTFRSTSVCGSGGRESRRRLLASQCAGRGKISSCRR